MRTRMILISVVLGTLGLFVALNWRLVMSPTELHLVVTKVNAPLGVVLLGFLGALTTIYVAFLARVEGTALREERRAFKQMDELRRLLEEKGSADLAQHRTWLESQFLRLHNDLGARRQADGRPPSS